MKCKEWYKKSTQKLKKNIVHVGGFEPTTFRAEVWCSTDWAIHACLLGKQIHIYIRLRGDYDKDFNISQIHIPR